MAEPIKIRKLQVGVQIHPQHVTYQDFINTTLHVEKLGVDTIWNWDHFFPLGGDARGNHFEGWTLLTAMAALTTHTQIGCLVTCNSYRNPALLANMAKTVDHISNGRLILGIGAGWCEHDYQEYGYDFGTASTRIADLEKALSIILHRWEVDVPRPVRYPIPILIGGSGEKKTLRLVAKYANVWHAFGDVPTITCKMQILNQWCDEIGRNSDEIERSVTINNNVTNEELDAYLLVGVTHFILDLETPWNFNPIERLVQWRSAKNVERFLAQ